MNTNVSIYSEPIVLDEGQTKERCDCGGVLVRSFLGDENGYRVTLHHCTFCTQDYYEMRGKINRPGNQSGHKLKI